MGWVEEDVYRQMRCANDDLKAEITFLQSALAQAREEIALLRIQKGQLEEREEAAEQREKGLVEALKDMFDPMRLMVSCQKRLMDKCMCSGCIEERAKAALAAASKEEAC